MSMRDGLFCLGFPNHVETYCPDCRNPESSGEHGLGCLYIEEALT